MKVLFSTEGESRVKTVIVLNRSSEYCEEGYCSLQKVRVGCINLLFYPGGESRVKTIIVLYRR